MNQVQIKFGKWIEDGFNLYKANIALLTLSSLIAVILSVATFGILGGPMLAGLLFITLRLFDNQQPKPEVGNVFRGFDFFLNALLFFLFWAVAILIACFIIGLVPCIGQLAALFLVYSAQALLMFGLFLIVDHKMDFWPASMESINTVKANFWPFLGFSVIASIIGSIGAIACGIGIIITAPIQACILTVAYREVFAERDAAVVGEETVPQPEDQREGPA
jgi:uncharacterized membrane protein